MRAAELQERDTLEAIMIQATEMDALVQGEDGIRAAITGEISQVIEMDGEPDIVDADKPSFSLHVRSGYAGC